MAIGTENNRNQYSGNGVIVAHPVTFYFVVNSWVKAILTDSSGVDSDLTEGVHYTLTGATVATGGELTMITPPALNETLTIYRDAPYNQGVTFEYVGIQPAESMEDGLDKNTILIQQLKDLTQNLALVFPQSEPIGTSNVMPDLASRVDQYLGFDGNGDIVSRALPTLTSGTLLDEDDLSSDSDTDGTTQQAVKAYIDALNVTLSAVDVANLITAKAYTDTIDTANSVTDQAHADAQDAIHSTSDRAYTDTIDTANSATDQAYSDANLVTAKAYTDDVTPATNTADYLPQWDGANSRTLKDGKEVVTSISGSSTDAQILTAKGVYDHVVATTAYPMMSMTRVTATSFNATPAPVLTYTTAFHDYADFTYSLANGSITIPSTGRYEVSLTCDCIAHTWRAIRMQVDGSDYTLGGITPLEHSQEDTAGQTKDSGHYIVVADLTLNEVITMDIAMVGTASQTSSNFIFSVRKVPN